MWQMNGLMSSILVVRFCGQTDPTVQAFTSVTSCGPCGTDSKHDKVSVLLIYRNGELHPWINAHRGQQQTMNCIMRVTSSDDGLLWRHSGDDNALTWITDRHGDDITHESSNCSQSQSEHCLSICVCCRHQRTPKWRGGRVAMISDSQPTGRGFDLQVIEMSRFWASCSPFWHWAHGSDALQQKI